MEICKMSKGHENWKYTVKIDVVANMKYNIPSKYSDARVMGHVGAH